ncbi:MAG: serine/threonine protein kinase [Anaerolineae bacterium]|jgi:glycine amidinotransferase
MSNETGKTIVNSWNEWDSLKHVIVGRPDGTMMAAPEPAQIMGFPDAGVAIGEWGPLPADLTEQATEQMDALAKMMEERGIRVDRPTPLDFGQKVQTPDWEQDSMFGCMPPRDVLMVVGHEILEATMGQRSRWYEYLCYRPLLEQYFQEDPNFVWEAAPKPRLSDASYVENYWHNWYNVWTYEEKTERMEKLQFQLTEKEPIFDAADIIRFGKDLFMQRSAITNAAGVEWLRRHFEPKGFRVHEVAFGGTVQPWHIDCTVFAPREGVLVQNPDWLPLRPEFHELFKINGWEIVLAAPPSRPQPHPYSFCSTYLSNNTFSLDPNTLCIESGEVQLMEQMDRLGFEVIPVDFFEVSPFGGGLHCATTDVHREGDCEDYFPKQIPGF